MLIKLSENVSYSCSSLLNKNDLRKIVSEICEEWGCRSDVFSCHALLSLYSVVWSFLFVFPFLRISSFERQGCREQPSAHWLNLTNGHNKEGWTRLKLETWYSNLVSSIWAICCCFPKCLAGDWIWSGAAITQTVTQGILVSHAVA